MAACAAALARLFLSYAPCDSLVLYLDINRVPLESVRVISHAPSAGGGSKTPLNAVEGDKYQDVITPAPSSYAGGAIMLRSGLSDSI